MAPRPAVPYSGVPGQSASMVPIPSVHVDSPLAAFGGAVAAANQELGSQLEKSSDTIFARAQDFQKLAAEAEARDADSQYMIEAGNLHATFSAKLGKDANDAYPQYQQDLRDARDRIRAGISNPYAQRLYDGPSLSTMGRTIFNGAGHAATQLKQYALGAIDNRVKAYGDQALTMPDDDVAFQRSINATREDMTQMGKLHGWDQEETDQKTAQALSSLHVKRVEAIARQSPMKAQDMLDDAIADGNIRGEDIAKVTNFVRQQTHTVGARNISHDISTGADMPGAAPVPISQAKAAIGGYESGNNYQSLGREVFNADGTSRGRALGKYQVMPENLPSFLSQAGLPSMTQEEFLKNPGAQEAVFEKVFGNYMKQYGSFNEAASMWFSGKTLAQAGNARDANKTTVPEYLRQTNAILARGMSLADKEARGREMAQKMFPDDPLAEDFVVQRISADHNQQQAVKRNDDYANRQVVQGALLGGQGDKLPTTVEELKADPKVEAAWNALDPTLQKGFLRQLAANAKGDLAPSEASLRRVQQLRGMASESPDEFLKVDIPSEHLPLSDRRSLMTLQQQVLKGASSDPQITKAMGIMAQELREAGIADNKDDRFQFRGAFQEAIRTFTETNKRPPKYEEIKEIGNNLLREQASSWWERNAPRFFGGGGTQQWRVPSDEAEKIKADPRWQGRTPTDSEVQRYYIRDRYQELFGKAPKAEAQNTGPQVPQSK